MFVFLEGALASELCKSRRRILCKAANRFRESQIDARKSPSPLFVDPSLSSVNVTTRRAIAACGAARRGVAFYTPLIRICWTTTTHFVYPDDIFTASLTRKEFALHVTDTRISVSSSCNDVYVSYGYKALTAYASYVIRNTCSDVATIDRDVFSYIINKPCYVTDKLIYIYKNNFQQF